MDFDETDLEFFESNLRAIIQAGELGKHGALVSILRPNTSDPQLGKAIDDDAQQESQCGAPSDFDNEQDDLQASTEWRFKGYLYFATTQWTVTAGETYEDAVWAAFEEQYLPTVPVPVQHVAICLQFCGRTQ